MRIFIDCTDTYYSGANTGIQRVVRNIAKWCSASPTGGTKVQAVILSDGKVVPIDPVADLNGRPVPPLRQRLSSRYQEWTRSLARALPLPFLQRFLLAHRNDFGLAWLLWLPIRVVVSIRNLCQPPKKKGDQGSVNFKVTAGDVLFLPDATWMGDQQIVASALAKKNVRVAVLVHDILPLTYPQYFAPEHIQRFKDWFEQTVDIADFFVYNSKVTESSVRNWLTEFSPNRATPPGAVVYLGHDHSPSANVHIKHNGLRRAFKGKVPTFICVGTIEPRKRHDVLVDAFDLLWREGTDCSLIIIGRSGWLCADILARLTRHAEHNKRLFWFQDVDDTDLDAAYRNADGMIFCSEAEGFGLPLVEALGRGLPVIASDIPIFREIANQHARFFALNNPASLAVSIRQLVGCKVRSVDPAWAWPTWQEATDSIVATLTTAFTP